MRGLEGNDMTQLSIEQLLQKLTKQGWLKTPSQAEASLLISENLPTEHHWGFWLAYCFWLLIWLSMGVFIVLYTKNDWGFYGYISTQMLLSCLLYLWPQRSAHFDSFLHATLTSIGLNTLLFLLPIPLSPVFLLSVNLTLGGLLAIALIVRTPDFRKTHPFVLAGFCALTIALSFLTSPIIIYSIVLMLLSLDTRKFWLSIFGMILLVIGLGDLAYIMPFSFKISSLLLLGTGVILIVLPFFWHRSAKTVAQRSAP